MMGLDESDLKAGMDEILKKIGKSITRSQALNLLAENYMERRRAPSPYSPIRIHPLCRFYHWWQEPDGIKLKIARSFITNAIE